MLIIIGAGAFGREIYSWASQSNYKIKGFLDGRPNILNKNYPPILSSVEKYTPCKDDEFICAIGDQKYREYYTNIIQSKQGKFINVIHKSAIIGNNTIIGNGIMICPQVVISCDVIIKNNIIINTHSFIAHDSIIEDYVNIFCNVTINGNCKIKKYATIASNACILPNSTISNNAIVGANSTVLKFVKPNTTVFGTPAKRI